MKILLVAGISRSLLNFRGQLLADLVELGHEVHAAAGETEPEVVRALETSGIHYHPLPLNRTSLNPAGDIQLLLRLRGLMRTHRPDILLAYTIKPVIWGGIASQSSPSTAFFALITGLGQVFTAESVKRRILQALASRLYGLALRRASGVIFQNGSDRDLFVREQITSLGKSHIVDGSGVDLTHFHLEELPAGPPQFLLIARLLRAKGVLEYCEVARRVRAIQPDATFHLVGPTETGGEAVSLAALSSFLDDKSVCYHGSVSDVRPHIKSSHVFVFPSYYNEGLSRSLLESLATGRPIITTDHPGCREAVLCGTNGVLGKKMDADDLFQKTLWMLENREQWPIMGAASRKLAEEKFDVRKVNADMLRILGLN
jgi:glycosyltransferase involved in cell wall biosynthesis